MRLQKMYKTPMCKLGEKASRNESAHIHTLYSLWPLLLKHSLAQILTS